MKPLILGINGSPNQNGRVEQYLKLVLKEIGIAGGTTRLLNLRKYKILPHRGALNAKSYLEKSQDDMAELVKQILRADGVIFATPTHWFHVSSLMKLFIDRLTSLEHYNFLLEGKTAGVITYGPQGGALNSAMNLLMILNQWGMSVPPYGTLFDEGRQDKWFARDLKLLAKNILTQIKISRQTNWGYKGAKYKYRPTELI
ncbi:MAG: hypothetical protein A3J07_01090 [Candidatus Doudnabacteria bacterium RIFCSPLOWO2_02_FULL_49_13]|uniref:NADPH-dependent FMN reductase-like domain-containing protein n=1 Tax=Candidatus Doudnabacteria bacterium RIFCSPHIGHO2_12_FULL_48_16 TaxID=1817838 RepID=A0A1F5PK68_9BACT|nr:MAG: hypothetical protein A3B77_04020 [Candidatus Doudnabacteria bacterium RIFCSPHIGHO2_02_FULL_49_24]OGE88653.1 MAG: hypothetical protein A2760_01680 [Candidatus Doudnabacteria bacterium RIFCSPHIGHO2_01_FULL_50_67]OGE90338.1 MAG: hypothetical protein A3E29_04600 [Candidatus Doudnabacteria bacterium RIFCSPHIGHO2_12_FULL_48_16]OGE97045.1 MAG: hypothetical protein A2990_01590 [Candidatus Doudnabacteria bacterium RIFCSPLOWO2_01_FULL_49_40]OGF02394.1 MAG: hypothetical protein A3J07_01090 [Candid